MTAYFFDSSAIVKRYLNEKGSGWVAATAKRTSSVRIYLAAITGVEVVAAITRQLKGKRVSSEGAAAAVSLFHHDFANEYLIIGISNPVITRSMTLAETHALKGYDAVQLGAALEVNERRMTLGATTPLTLVTGDIELLNAAAAEGLLIENPDTH